MNPQQSDVEHEARLYELESDIADACYLYLRAFYEHNDVELYADQLRVAIAAWEQAGGGQ